MPRETPQTWSLGHAGCASSNIAASAVSVSAPRLAPSWQANSECGRATVRYVASKSAVLAAFGNGFPNNSPNVDTPIAPLAALSARRIAGARCHLETRLRKGCRFEFGDRGPAPVSRPRRFHPRNTSVRRTEIRIVLQFFNPLPNHPACQPTLCQRASIGGALLASVGSDLAVYPRPPVKEPLT